MSEELTVQQGCLVPKELQSTALGNFADVSTSSTFLPYIQLFGSSSNAVKEGKISMGHFGLGRSSAIEALGDEFICLIVSWRPKAIRFSPTRVVVYDMQDDDFSMIKDAAKAKQEGYAYGPEFLLWLPDFKTFAVYHLNNPTGQREAGNVMTFLGNVCKFSSHLNRNKKGQTWHGPKVSAFAGDVELPDWSAASEVIENFRNPVKYSEDELAEEESRER